MSALILIVEDEADLVLTLEYGLAKEGFRTRVARDGAEALVEAKRQPIPDLVLLDLMLPRISGTDVCRELRTDPATKHAAIVMLTARSEEVDRLVGFELGADDYVTKPYSPRELALRIHAILRRTRSQPEVEEKIQVGPLVLDPGAHSVRVDGEPVALTAIEFRLLETLATRCGRVQSRKELLDEVWGITGDVHTRTVDTHVRRVRQKLGDAGDMIETLRGVGYRFRHPV